MVWSQLTDIRAPPIVTSDFLYIRFIGDRTIQDFGRIQKDRVSELGNFINNKIVTEIIHSANFSVITILLRNTSMNIIELM